LPISTEKIHGETWFKISDHDTLRPFFINVVSDSNHWMFISSNGGLTAGRKNPEYALFPYYTVDKIIDLAQTTGSKTILQMVVNDSVRIWEPFSERYADQYRLSRNLFKNRLGNKILFEEINHDLGLVFRYQWNSSNMYGFVRKASLRNMTEQTKRVAVLDGIQNVLPHGIDTDLQTSSSNLADAYKRNELDQESGLGIFALSAMIVDKAEPSEALKANAVWSFGLKNPTHLLSSLQLNRFRNQQPLQEEHDVKGEKGAYFVRSEIELSAGSHKDWAIVANVNLDHAHMVRLIRSIKEDEDLPEKVNRDIERGSDKLLELVAGSDGLQVTDDPFRDTRHYSNVLFNIMRGGTFDHNYQIEKKDFVDYVRGANKDVYNRHHTLLRELDNKFSNKDLEKLIATKADPDLKRLGTEYLPLKFSRRHGDPSRPWNQFSINTHSEIDGSKILDYEGNWRDIFQNWEALVYSYPGFIEGMIYKFLNASTFDGYNPYRVTKGGFDWETIDPDDPWSYIGYWGDHQIIYLLKFLEFYHNHDPEAFKELFDTDEFVYADVPYRLKSYDKIAADPKNTIEFDEDSDRTIRRDVEKSGADGALLGSDREEIHHVHFMEKILATVLSKVSNFIPEGGIWMNTQRPEWNDANNALVGNGVSMVTLCYLRRFLRFFEPLTASTELDEVEISEELHEFFESQIEILKNQKEILNGPVSDADRKRMTDALGKTGSKYRCKIYDHGFSGEKRSIQMSQVKEYIDITNAYLEHSIRANKREDHLYHSYNLMSMEPDGVSISHTEEMLEGQVAVLSSGYLSSDEALEVLDALRNSSLYREDQQSYILYPNKELPGFLEKNSIPKEQVENSKLLMTLVSDGNMKIVKEDVDGGYHFNGNFKNARDLEQALSELESNGYAPLVQSEKRDVLQIFESVFNHKAFTGRSGTFFAYEGLGSIYWHMVSKLNLAVFEVCRDAAHEQADRETIQRLNNHFDEVKAGIGIHKPPEVYGAFPVDPYSHTPQHRGAQQPGMTGQVKEDILVRMGELGMFVRDGKLIFDPFLLKKEEFRSTEKEIDFVTLNQKQTRVSVPEHTLLFTRCQVPVVYEIGGGNSVTVSYNDGSSLTFEDLQLDEEKSRQLFQRTGAIKKLKVSLSEKHLR